MTELNEIEMRKKFMQDLEIKSKARETQPNTFTWKTTPFLCIRCGTQTVFTYTEFDNIEQEEVYDDETGREYVCANCNIIFHAPEQCIREEVIKSLEEFCAKL